MSEILAPRNTALANCSFSSTVILPLGSVGFFAAWSISRNSARKIGICKMIGRQEANGLVPDSL